MTIEKVINDKTTKLIIKGRIDSITANDLDTSITDCTSKIKNLILDFNAVEYVSSACLRILLKAQKRLKKQGNMKLINVNENVMEVFKITGFNDILEIEERSI